MGLQYDVIPSPVGGLFLAVDSSGQLRKLLFSRDEDLSRLVSHGDIHNPHALVGPRKEIEEYFRGVRTHFETPLAPQGSAFQRLVWAELLKIPYGTTKSYLDVALCLGDASAVRAVGTANGANPIAIMIPCHRVIGSNGKLVGYGGGLETKRALLELERVGTPSLFGTTD